MFDHLMEPIQIGSLSLKNRSVFPAMGTRYCTDDGHVLDQLIDYHVRRVQGGCALNITEAVAVHRRGSVTKMLQISDDSYIPGLKKLTDAIHENGGKACIQLWESGMACLRTPGSKPLLPRDLPLGPNMVLPAATIEEIHEAVKAFGTAAKRAVEAGFDCMEFHAAHFYSPHEFLTPAFNNRTDEYGGSKENRARYPLECIREIRANIPADMPLILRIDSMDDDLPGGLTTEDIIEFCLWAKEAGVDILSISRGNKISPRAMCLEVPPIDVERGFNIEPAAKIKAGTGMPLIGVGRVNDPAMADAMIAEGKIDMIAMGRAQIADPDFMTKAKEGRVEDILRCIGCNQGCYDYCTMEKPITCLRNPEVGKEAYFASLSKAETPKTVLVAGGGIGGIEAAIRATMQGHHAVLAEKADELGGQFIIAGKAPRKEEMELAVRSRAEQAKRAGIDIRLNTEVTKELLDEIRPDAVISAVGASPIHLNIEGTDGKNVYTANDVLLGKAVPQGKTVIIGGGLVGLETAEYVRALGNPTTVVEMLEEAGKDIGMGRKAMVLSNLKAAEIETMVNTKVLSIIEEGVNALQNDEELFIPADSVIVAVGSTPNSSDEIEQWCTDHNVFFRRIGDAVKARRALNAVHEATEAVIEIA